MAKKQVVTNYKNSGYYVIIQENSDSPLIKIMETNISNRRQENYKDDDYSEYITGIQ